MRILISGSHGFIGAACCSYFQEQGHTVVRLVRSKKDLQSGSSIYWNPEIGDVEKEDFEDFDAVIHLAGLNVTAKRWSKKFKNQLFLSRCRDTWLLSQVLRRLYRPPQTLITASAIGFYGDRGEEILTEESSQGSGFLANVVGEWESASTAIENRGVRVVRARFGVVLGFEGGILSKLSSLYKLGCGATLGSGKQYVSWIALEDLVRGVEHLLHNGKIAGGVNFTAPCPVTQKEFSRALGDHLGRQVFLRIPERVVRLVLGEMGEELLLFSARASADKLLQSGYIFKAPTIEDFFQNSRFLGV